MDTTSDLAVAESHSVEPAQWRRTIDLVIDSFAGRFCRVEPRRAAAGFVTGLLTDLEIKTCWQVAEQAGHARPDAMQRLLYRAKWDADAVRDDVRKVVADRLGDPDGVLVVDETGDLKKGVHTVGVQRQYTGTAGRIENAQVGVFLAYASRHGHALIDRRIYLPKSWTDDRGRCEQAGVPDDVTFATRSELADDMITTAVKALVPARWVAADEAYGNNTRLRGELRKLRLGYVLAVSRDHLVPIDGGKTRCRADRLAAGLPSTAWTRRSAGDGSKGPRFYCPRPAFDIHPQLIDREIQSPLDTLSVKIDLKSPISAQRVKRVGQLLHECRKVVRGHLAANCYHQTQRRGNDSRFQPENRRSRRLVTESRRSRSLPVRRRWTGLSAKEPLGLSLARPTPTTACDVRETSFGTYEESASFDADISLRYLHSPCGQPSCWELPCDFDGVTGCQEKGMLFSCGMC